MPITREDAKGFITQPIRDKLRSSILEAFQDYDDLPPSLKITLSATTRASFVNDRMCFHARSKMINMPAIDFIKRRGRWHLVIFGEKDALEVKFKKLDYNRRPSNIPTTESSEFTGQVQLEMPGVLGTVTNLVAGYQLNTTRTGIRGIFIVCPIGTHNKWEISVPISVVSLTTLLPTAPNIQNEIDIGQKKVLPKASIVKKI